jgi:hypothetical protein
MREEGRGWFGEEGGEGGGVGSIVEGDEREALLSSVLAPPAADSSTLTPPASDSPCR